MLNVVFELRPYLKIKPFHEFVCASNIRFSCILLGNGNGRFYLVFFRFSSKPCNKYDYRYNDYYNAYVTKCFYIGYILQLKQKTKTHTAQITAGPYYTGYQAHVLFVYERHNTVSSTVGHFQKQGKQQHG